VSKKKYDYILIVLVENDIPYTIPDNYNTYCNNNVVDYNDEDKGENNNDIDYIVIDDEDLVDDPIDEQVALLTEQFDNSFELQSLFNHSINFIVTVTFTSIIKEHCGETTSCCKHDYWLFLCLQEGEP
jgi:hypothetical protein